MKCSYENVRCTIPQITPQRRTTTHRDWPVCAKIKQKYFDDYFIILTFNRINKVVNIVIYIAIIISGYRGGDL